jgi:hypothetical protein
MPYSVQDGFHPNQYAKALEVAVVIEYATQNFPDVLGEENQYNDIISEGQQHTSAAYSREIRMKNWLGL